MMAHDQTRTHHGSGMDLGSPLLPIATIGYLYLPILIFILTWTRWYVAIPVICVSGFCVIRMTRFWRDRKAEKTPLTLPMLLATLMILALVSYLVGWGGFTPQAMDWHKHNAIMHDLIDCPWPVAYRNGDEVSMLTYYIGQYLVPAGIGKLFGSFEVACVATFFWNLAGLTGVSLMLMRVCKADSTRKQVICLLVLFLFGGLIALGKVCSQVLFPELKGMLSHADHWFCFTRGIALQYSPDLVLLRWVFNQTLAPWLIVLLFLCERQQIRCYVPLALPMALYGILPFLGMVVMLVSHALCMLARDWKNRRAFLHEVFSIENILCTLSLGMVLFLYFAGNVFSEKPDGIGLQLVTYGSYWPLYLCFVFFTFGCYALLLLPSWKRDPLYWTSVIALALIPLFHMGAYNDFVMRTSIPFLFVLMVMTCTTLLGATVKPASIIVKILLACCLVAASLMPLRELARNQRHDHLMDFTQSADGFHSIGYSANRMRTDKPVDLRYNYLTYDLDDHLFTRFIARDIHPQEYRD